jgi:hypothetical protein
MSTATREKVEYRPVPIGDLMLDPDCQPRAEISQGAIADYREDVEAGASFVPIAVFFDGEVYWVADGFHRAEAFHAAGEAEVPCEVRPGGKREAILHSVGANGAHGLRRTNADKRRAVLTLLNDEEWHAWSDSEIARRCGVSQPFVAKLRPESHFKPFEVTERRRVDKHGHETSINTANIGRKPAQTRQLEPQPPDDDAEFYQGEPGDEPAAAAEEYEDEPADVMQFGEDAEPSLPGRSIVNGVEQDDPPEIAEQRRRGTMPPGVVPTIEINDPATIDAAPEPEPAEELPEKEWLRTLPLYRRLSGEPQRKFIHAARFVRRFGPTREVIRHATAEALRGLGHDNEAVYFLKSFLRIGDPKHWPACPPTAEGGCDGMGTVPGMDTPCPLCRGRGFRCRERRRA